MKSLISFFINRKILTLTLSLIIIILGLLSINKIPIELLPALDTNQLTINISAGHLSPEYIEKEITSPIESLAATLKGIENIKSSTEKSRGTITLDVSSGRDIDIIKYELKDKIKGLDIPDSAHISYNQGPSQSGRNNALDNIVRVFSADNSAPFQIRISGGRDSIASDIIKKEIQIPLNSLPSVANSRLYGAYENYLQCLIDSDKMERSGLTLNDVDRAFSSYKTPVQKIGFIAPGKINVYLDKSRDNLDEIKELLLTNSLGSVIKLDEIMDVREIHELPENRSWVNGRPAIVLDIEKKNSANLIAFSKEINQTLNELKEKHADKIRIDILSDSGSDVLKIFRNMGMQLGVSLLGVFLVILLFLKSVRPTIAVILSLLLAFLLSAVLLSFSGIAISLITVSAFILSAGILVDNSLVILEQLRDCKSKDDIVLSSARVVPVILAGSLTNIVIFLPFCFLDGAVGGLLKPFAICIIVSMFSSVIISAVLVPSVYYRLIFGKRPVSRKSGGRFILPLLKMKIPLCALLILLIAASGFTLIPNVLQNRTSSAMAGRDKELRLYFNMLSDANVEETEKIAKEFEKIALDYFLNEPITLVNNIGRTSAALSLTVVSNSERAAEMLSGLQEIWAMNMGNYISVQFSLSGPNGRQATGNSLRAAGSSVSGRIKIEGYEYSILKENSEKLADFIKNIPSIYAVDSGFERSAENLFGPSFPGYDLIVNTNNMALLNIRSVDIETGLKLYDLEFYEGTTVRQNKDVLYRIQPSGTMRFFRIEEILDIPVPGSSYVIGDVAVIRPQTSSSVINRENQKYIHYVSYVIRGREAKDALNRIRQTIKTYPFPPGFGAELVDMSDEAEDMELNSGLSWILLLSAALVFMTLSGFFESFIKPIFVFLSIPLAVFFVFIIYYIFSLGLGAGGLLGLILLTGISVNDAILFINSADKELLRYKKALSKNGAKGFSFGISKIDLAINKAIGTRARPIILTSLTTVFAMLPQIFLGDTGTTAPFWKEFSIVVTGGIIGSTLFALFFIPLFYSLFLNMRAGRRSGKSNY